MSNNLCMHLQSIKDAINNYRIILAFYVTCIDPEGPERKLKEGYCKVCRGRRRLYACLECPYFACLKFLKNGTCGHMKRHFFKTGHAIAIHIDLGTVFCFKCDDIVCHEEFESCLKEFKLESLQHTGDRVYNSYTPDAEEKALLRDPVKRIIPTKSTGLRSIVNAGNSCYTNCIMQVLIHTPLLKKYFLGDNHLCFSKTDCLACELLLIFQEFYSGKKFSYNPSRRFFFKLQKFCKTRIVLQQEDSYELFQEILTGLHDCMKIEDEETSKISSCICLIHDSYYGINQSYKECSACKATSILPLEHFMDILLNQDKDQDSLPQMLSRRYLEPQLLHDLKCESCGEKDTTYMFQWIKKLPKIMCIRINCFNLYGGDRRKNLQKKSSGFDFGHAIDMTPYLKRKFVELATTDLKNNIYAFENMYCLFAIIFHKSDIKGGHYSTYVRHFNNRWYECDDQYVYERNADEVIQCKPFLLFYTKMI